MTARRPPAEFVTALVGTARDGRAQMRTARAIIHGQLDRPRVVRCAARYYGELRAFLDLKLPERLRLCGYGAADAKAFFAAAYAEEQGHFRPGADHASLFGRICAALGCAPAALEAEARQRTRRFAYMRELEPAPETLVRELAITYAWESVAPALGRAVGRGLARHYGVPAAALGFYTLHATVDRAHAAAARRVLLAHATTPALRRLALRTVAETLAREADVDG